MTALVGRLLVALIGAYRVVLSPLLPPSCRFTPTCSRYAELAVRRFGPWRGGGLALRRLVRCHPWGGSGWDPVPPGAGSSDAMASSRAAAEEGD